MTRWWFVADDGTVVGGPYVCPEDPVTVPTPLTSEIVARAFRRIELPASELQIQPPKGRTLVNFATNFYTERPAFDRTVTLLGRRVDLRIWPSRFRWVFGDGGELASTSRGRRTRIL
jgi:hypothetical protein